MGEAEAETEFAARFRRHYNEVLRFLERRVADREDASELAGDVFRVAWQRFSPGSRAERAWLYAIARNVLGDHYRRTARQATADQALNSAALIEAQTVSSRGPADHPILTALATLPATDQEAIRLRYWEHLSTAEVAEVLGITPVAARVRLHRARKQLRAALHTTLEPKGMRS
ncbi:MAG: sigma-70 family RNA polymerase sigma factor [Candidatus Microbacterium phytovorans]|uniref:Sigma-70 family RNA polymerase sigma factor n=1 Tax=Candidatus Microbacterium phytovorans TaxID=3121374 RepID=A0AAJ5W2E6_9MICO|nr:sigma-70 family RNA polymerase sigma factor [Microbacterium sp.]WEK14472.1 MAG: sigma-70 family RNA polymerase sigma factor [Microbacterium sp.]